MDEEQTWSALLEELVEVQRGGPGVSLLWSRRRGGWLLRLLHSILERSAGVRPGGEDVMIVNDRHRITGYDYNYSCPVIFTSVWFSFSSVGPVPEEVL